MAYAIAFLYNHSAVSQDSVLEDVLAWILKTFCDMTLEAWKYKQQILGRHFLGYLLFHLYMILSFTNNLILDKDMLWPP